MYTASVSNRKEPLTHLCGGFFCVCVDHCPRGTALFMGYCVSGVLYVFPGVPGCQCTRSGGCTGCGIHRLGDNQAGVCTCTGGIPRLRGSWGIPGLGVVQAGGRWAWGCTWVWDNHAVGCTACGMPTFWPLRRWSRRHMGVFKGLSLDFLKNPCPPFFF